VEATIHCAKVSTWIFVGGGGDRKLLQDRDCNMKFMGMLGERVSSAVIGDLIAVFDSVSNATELISFK